MNVMHHHHYHDHHDDHLPLIALRRLTTTLVVAPTPLLGGQSPTQRLQSSVAQGQQRDGGLLRTPG
jgi:hypothetical protein